MTYTLGLDLGTNSIGWCVLDLNSAGQPEGIRDIGVRLFSDGRNPKDKTSLAVARRTARSARRRRDRYLRRRTKLLRLLKEHGLLPHSGSALDAVFDPKQNDPYEIRSRGLKSKLSLHELGRAIFHLNQRRGFKSNRKTDGGGDEESGKIRSGVEKLRQAMTEAGAESLGAYLQQLHAKGGSVRTRLTPQPADPGKKPQSGYDFYPERAMIEEEFDLLWTRQSRHHATVLTDRARDETRDVLFFQRRLKPKEPGKCRFNPEEPRLARAHPLAQRIRIFQEVNNLRIVAPDQSERELTQDERDSCALALLSTPKRTFGQLRRLLKLPPDSRFNLESEIRKDLKGDETAAVLAHKKCFGANWRSFDSEQQESIVERLLEEEDEETLIAWLIAEQNLTEETARFTVRRNLPDGHAGLGITATRGILAQLEASVAVFAEATAAAGYHHSDFSTGEIFDSLPYYGRVLENHVAFGSGNPEDREEERLGKLANPTVHIGLNQIRRVVNALIARHGHPGKIVIEVARELKLNAKQKERISKTIGENTRRAERHREELQSLGLPDSGANRLRLRLWEELNPENPFERRCVYSGEQISLERLFTAAVDIDHILPFSQTLDNSAANKIVCSAAANKIKRNRPPHDAFGTRTDWPDTLARASLLPKNKRWRFAADAMQKFETDRNFLDRQLVDTQYLSRVAREYLTAVCNPNEVWVTPGRLTEMLRGRWGLNELLPDHNLVEQQNKKNRLDHRHHAIDAVVVAVTDRSLLNRISRAAGQAEDQQRERLLADMPTPWPTFRDDLKRALDDIVVSHRADHGSSGGHGRAAGRNTTSGRLHNDTAYGLAGEANAHGAFPVVHRVPLESLKSSKDIEKIRDPELRETLHAATGGLSGKDFAGALARFAQFDAKFAGIRRVRILETLSVLPVRDKSGRIYKAYKGDANERFDVWRLPSGKWVSEIITRFSANQPRPESADSRPHPAAKRMLRLHQNDFLAVEMEGERRLVRVVKFSTSGSMQLVPHNEGGNLKARDADKNDYLKYINTSASGLQKLRARQVRVDEIGRVLDPGPRS
ncbi:type II CRISPR RNA-guided endonuclease Cas9 [Denitrobaculum tricleocarpae]|uniref:CRISPR-associated endonuclease Cas9 n=1 Tax=Denitrobaculum tricleocarpae TaxID=2591009 RepID=A0A545TP29_9PROT|nr:type II CRISPR RNA-guided endonuclease Cas9 [Denitrobaculum tricleocarpae]TQV78979.1 type II CRISPR RNA-guided endonuclease Cas9 [Denitrobaculum tricleocarpae]